uniref:Sushi domain-containing protein n=1 Tax=Magallana gigas TaxID=29159 RepID=K1Q1L2_MAGGI
MGFIPDVLQLLQTYQLTDYLNTWLSDGSFPSKSAWKSTVRSSVNTHQTLQRIERTAYDPDFFRFNAIFSTSNPFIMWQYINSYNCGIPNRTGIDLNATHREDAIGIYRRIHASCSDGYFQFGSGRLICQSIVEWKYDIMCEEGWVQYGNHIYRLFNETKNWESAKHGIIHPIHP